MQQREVGLAHNLLEIMLPHKLRTQIIKRMTSRKVKVGTGRDAHTVWFVFVSICCGMVRLTNPQISQQEAQRQFSQWCSAFQTLISLPRERSPIICMFLG